MLCTSSLVLATFACSSSKPRVEVEASSDAGVAHCTTERDVCGKSQQICVVDGDGEHFQVVSERRIREGPGYLRASARHGDAARLRHVRARAREEIDALCQSWTLGNEDEVWVNAVELETNGGYHHSNWLFVPDDQYAGPDGAWRCSERGYSELQAAVAGGVLFAQSTQAKKQVQKFPDGAAVRLPPHARIIGGTHMLSTSEDPFDTTLELTVYTLPVADVTVPLAPFRLSYLDLTIPPAAISEFSGQCDLASAIKDGPGTLDMDLYYVLPHYHSLGHSFHLETSAPTMARPSTIWVRSTGKPTARRSIRQSP